MNLNTCLRDALIEAGLDITKTVIPSKPVLEDLAQICFDLGIEPFINCDFYATVGEPLIMIFKTRPGWEHAEFTTDAREIAKSYQVVAVIRIESH